MHIFSLCQFLALKLCKLGQVTYIGSKSLFLKRQHCFVCPQLFCWIRNVKAV